MQNSRKEIALDYQLTDLPITALGGLPIIVEAIRALGIDKLFDKHLNLKLRNRGYTEHELALAVILTLIAGGSDIEDADKIGMDEVVGHGHFPHSTTIGDFLRRFTDEEQFEALQQVQDEMNRAFLKQMGYPQLTFDIDATIIPAEGKKRQGTGKAFNGDIGFQPLLLFAAEPGLVLGHEFRPANVHPGSGAVALLKHGLTVIPHGVKLHLRSDSACFNKVVVQFWDAEGRTFSITADLTSPLLAAIAALPTDAWQRLDNSEEVAELFYQPTGWAKAYRFIVVRRGKGEDLLGIHYGYHAFVTNLTGNDLGQLLKRHRRHANVENGIKELKGGFSLSVLPCLAYRANRAWFHLGVIANDLFCIVKLLFLPAEWALHRVKTIRWRLIQIGGVMVRHARRTFLKISGSHPWCEDLVRLRSAVRAYA